MADFSFEVRGPAEGDGKVELPELPAPVMGEGSPEFKFDPRPPTERDFVRTQQAPERDNTDIVIQSGMTAGGATIGSLMHADQRNAFRRALELQEMRRMAADSAREVAAAQGLQDGPQTRFERAIQGGREGATGTTGRARQNTYNTETSRQAQVRRGVDNPFTQSTWGATDQGVLAPPEEIDNFRANQARQQQNMARAAARRELLMRGIRSPLSILEFLARSRLAGAVGGGLAGYDAYEAYKAAKEGRTADALSSGVSSVGGLISMIPTVPTVVGGGALAVSPMILRKLLEDRQDEQQ